jgi:hypothetical protein
VIQLFHDGSTSILFYLSANLFGATSARLLPRQHSDEQIGLHFSVISSQKCEITLATGSCSVEGFLVMSRFRRKLATKQIRLLNYAMDALSAPPYAC